MTHSHTTKREVSKKLPRICIGDKVLIDNKYIGEVEELKQFPTLKVRHIEAVIRLAEKWDDGRTERVAIPLIRLKRYTERYWKEGIWDK